MENFFIGFSDEMTKISKSTPDIRHMSKLKRIASKVQEALTSKKSKAGALLGASFGPAVATAGDEDLNIKKMLTGAIIGAGLGAVAGAKIHSKSVPKPAGKLLQFPQ